MDDLGGFQPNEENLLDRDSWGRSANEVRFSGRHSTSNSVSEGGDEGGDDGELDHEWTDLLGTIQGTDWQPGRFYFSDVVACSDEGEATQVCSELVDRGRDYRGDLLLIAQHGDHVHAVHDCPYSNRQDAIF